MIHPTLNKDGKNNWKDVDWDDKDIGEYTNLCPDKRRAEFEYGSLCIVEAAKRGPLEKMFSSRSMSPSKIKRDLKRLINAFDRLSPDTVLHLKVNARFGNPTNVMQEYLRCALDRVGPGAPGPDRSRENLGEDAWAIWAAHGGKTKGKGKGEGPDFEAYVERLLIDAGFTSENEKKNRASTDNVVRDIRRSSKTRGPRGWQLW